MIKIIRPSKPKTFESIVQPEKSRIEISISDSVQLYYVNKWKDFKHKFSRAQYGKCGYCESFVVVGQDGDVEHYRPKGQIDEVISPGAELDNIGNVRGRKFKVIKKPGYWWLAYDWSNFLLSCANCNRKWKKNVFPVKTIYAQIPDDREIPLLLNPYGRIDPSNHMIFNDLGAVQPKNNSPIGRATIDTCGLDRVSLTRARKEKAQKAHELVKELIDALEIESKELIINSLRMIREAGNEEYNYSGIMRSVLKQRTDITWKELLKMLRDI